MEAILTTNVDAENKCLFNHKTVCGALNRQFFVGAVRCWRSFFRSCFVHCLRCLWCVGLVALLDFFVWLCALAKNTNVPPKAVAHCQVKFLLEMGR